MVSNLKFYRQDPQGKGRGRGYFYYRGALKQQNGRRIKTWSKYNEHLDGIKKHKRTKVRDVAKAEKNRPHKLDAKTKSGNRRTHRMEGKGPLGFY